MNENVAKLLLIFNLMLLLSVYLGEVISYYSPANAARAKLSTEKRGKPCLVFACSFKQGFPVPAMP
jgi:hypothetical protein